MINLGDEVKDRVSGFQGIAYGRHTYLQGCSRITVQPPVEEDGKLPESAVFDEPLLDILEAGKVRPVMADETGGPKDHAPIPRR